MTTEDKKIHPTHFQVPEMPWRTKELRAILLFKKVIEAYRSGNYHNLIVDNLLNDNKDLVEWIVDHNDFLG